MNLHSVGSLATAGSCKLLFSPDLKTLLVNMVQGSDLVEGSEPCACSDLRGSINQCANDLTMHCRRRDSRPNSPCFMRTFGPAEQLEQLELPRSGLPGNRTRQNLPWRHRTDSVHGPTSSRKLRRLRAAQPRSGGPRKVWKPSG